MEPLQMLPKTRRTRFEVAHGADDDRVLGGGVENPLVVLQPGATLNLNRTYDAEPIYDLPIPVWQGGLVESCIILVRPGDALRSARVEKMYLGVNDRHGAGGCGSSWTP